MRSAQLIVDFVGTQTNKFADAQINKIAELSMENQTAFTIKATTLFFINQRICNTANVWESWYWVPYRHFVLAVIPERSKNPCS